MKWGVLALALAGCATAPAPPAATVPEAITAASRVCPEGVAEPTPPSTPRTVEAIGLYSRQLRIALQRTEWARTVCAQRLREMNDLIDAWAAQQEVTP